MTINEIGLFITVKLNQVVQITLILIIISKSRCERCYLPFIVKLK